MFKPKESSSSTGRLRALLGSRQKMRNERQFAERVCAELTEALQEVHAAQPGLAGDALYEAVVARRGKLEPAQARALVWRAHQSLADWGADREPKFIDVARCLIACEYLGPDAGPEGMVVDLGELLTNHFDPKL